MAVPIAVGELAIAAMKSEAAAIALKKIGDYVWPKIAKSPAKAAGDATLDSLALNVEQLPTRLEMEKAFDSLEERLASLIDVRGQADLLVIKRWVIALGIGQMVVLAAVMITLFR